MQGNIGCIIVLNDTIWVNSLSWDSYAIHVTLDVVLMAVHCSFGQCSRKRHSRHCLCDTHVIVYSTFALLFINQRNTCFYMSVLFCSLILSPRFTDDIVFSAQVNRIGVKVTF